MCYRMVLNRVTFDEARRKCASLGATLAYPQSVKDNNFISDVLFLKWPSKPLLFKKNMKLRQSLRFLDVVLSLIDRPLQKSRQSGREVFGESRRLAGCVVVLGLGRERSKQLPTRRLSCGFLDFTVGSAAWGHKATSRKDRVLQWAASLWTLIGGTKLQTPTISGGTMCPANRNWTQCVRDLILRHLFWAKVSERYYFFLKRKPSIPSCRSYCN